MKAEINEIVRKRIYERAEEEYRKFQSGLIPGEHRIMGVRMPCLRKLAKEIARDDWREYLDNALEEYYEEVMLQGLVIGYAKASPVLILEYVSRFIPKINNWAICDSFCTGLKLARKQPEMVWAFIQPYLRSSGEYEVRFAVVMMLTYYMTDDYIDQVLSLLDQVCHEGYYVKMGVAWAISVCFVEYPAKTMAFLKSCNLDDFTFNKSLQKILESYRVDPISKATLREMKRK